MERMHSSFDGYEKGNKYDKNRAHKQIMTKMQKHKRQILG